MERDFSYYEANYGEYLDSLDEKKRLAHRIAFEVLGTSYQLPYTMDYLEYQKNERTPQPPAATEPVQQEEQQTQQQAEAEEEQPPPKKKIIRRIKRKNIKRRVKKKTPLEGV